MLLEQWMIVVLLGGFMFALYQTWTKAYNQGSEDLATMLHDMGIIEVEFTKDGILRISSLGEYEIKEEDEDDEEAS